MDMEWYRLEKGQGFKICHEINEAYMPIYFAMNPETVGIVTAYVLPVETAEFDYILKDIITEQYIGENYLEITNTIDYGTFDNF